jgi:hypothetical protein
MSYARRRAYRAWGMLGTLPSGARPVAELPDVFEDVLFAERPPSGATHYVAQDAGPTVTFEFFDASGASLGTQTNRRAAPGLEEEGIVAPTTAPPGKPGTVVPPVPKSAPASMFFPEPGAPGDGFDPRVAVAVGAVLVTVGVLGAVAYALSRRRPAPPPLATNRSRARRRARRRRR